ncbi:hypothetical protein [Streptomyces sp. NRRL WC-3742]|uniref:hypothetical protein n=1 Tax=Streptomyces sp. NRRL WC-3742 TaxID=1463934 RepID=UPI0004C862E7|nr:hypothetical protein [Streptomyces sp. NRRL WC-3742]
MAQRRYEYAPANTLLGLLQRGRGRGALIAAEDAGASAELVYACIRYEWRWDPQLDDRALYLARLIRDLELPLGPVTEMLAGGSDTRERAARVLELLDGPPRREPRRVDPRSEQDVPTLIAELERHWVEQQWRGPAALARGLARFGAEAAGAASLLRRFWLCTPHSYERAAYLEALLAMEAPGTAEAAVESLWDCEASARLFGIRHAPDRPDVLRRIACLRDDPMEEPDVREAAASVLRGTSGPLL